MKKSDITHPRGTAMFVIEHAAWQRSRGRKPSETFLDIRSPREALAVSRNLVAGRCGCGGELIAQSGCERYLSDPYYDLDLSSESMRWHCGLGFGSLVLNSSSEAVMSMHLQQWGMSHEQAHVIITQLSFQAA